MRAEHSDQQGDGKKLWDWQGPIGADPVAEWRRRQREGIARARAAGKYGRPSKLSAESVERLHEMVAQGVPKTRIARELGISRQSVYNVLKGVGVHAKADKGAEVKTYPRPQQTYGN